LERAVNVPVVAVAPLLEPQLLGALLESGFDLLRHRVTGVSTIEQTASVEMEAD